MVKEKKGYASCSLPFKDGKDYTKKSCVLNAM